MSTLSDQREKLAKEAEKKTAKAPEKTPTTKTT